MLNKEGMPVHESKTTNIKGRTEEGFFGVGRVAVSTFSENNPENKQVVFRNNLIVKPGRSFLINLLSWNGTGTQDQRFIEKVKWGSGGATVLDPFTPLAVDDIGTGITTPLLTQNLSTGYPQKLDENGTGTTVNPLQLKYVFILLSTATLSYPTSGVLLVNEATLCLNDETVFAHVTFPSISLNNAFGTGIELTWVIDFSNPTTTT
jgi:hypothetical protein